MATRYVNSKSKQKAKTGPKAYTTRSAAARRIKDALAAATDGDTIVILDAAVYAEGPIAITKPITIESNAWRTSTRKPTSANFSPTSYPQLHPAKKGSGRVILIESPKRQRNALGQVTLRGLTIENGRSTNAAGDPAQGGGAGIAVVDEDRVLIEDCCIRKNETQLKPFGMVSTVAFKDAVVKRLLDIASMVMPFLDKSSLAEIQTSARKALDNIMPDKREDSYLAAQTSGGGVLFLASSGKLSGCLVSDNACGGRGGGVGVIGYGWPTIDKCVIQSNIAGVRPHARKDGGGIGLEVAVPDLLARDLKESSLLDALTTWILAASTVTLLAKLSWSSLRGAFDTLRRMVSGGGVSDAAKQFLFDVLYRFSASYLSSEKDKSWDPASIKNAKSKRVSITDCTVQYNQAKDDGGGMYASVLSRSAIERCQFLGNKAGTGCGGAIRVSMGSDIDITSSTLSYNAAEAKKTMAPAGGGALAVRNCTVNVSGTGQSPSLLIGNLTGSWAGGGVFLEAVSEGSMAGVPNLWHVILTEVFDVTKTPCRFTGEYKIMENTAGSGGSSHGKGGGIYFIRWDFDEAPPLDVKLESFTRNVVSNVAKAGSTSPVVGAGAAVKTDQIDLVDKKKNIDHGDGQVSQHLSGRDFVYP